MIAVVVSLKVLPGHREDFLAAITENARRARESEPGCHGFDVSIDTQDDHHFVLYEVYEDATAFEAHRTTPHFHAWRAAAAEHLVPGSQVNTVTERLAP